MYICIHGAAFFVPEWRTRLGPDRYHMKRKLI